MKYARQVQVALERLDQRLLGLNRLIKEGKQREALEYMEKGPLKDAYDELQNIITVAGGPGSGGLGARGTSQTGAL